MDTNQFNELARLLGASRTRRGSLALAGALGVASAGLAAEAQARKHKKRKKKRKPQTTPPPAPPVAYADASCSASGVAVTAVRNAQTFLALRSGQLTSATIYLVQNSAGVSLALEIWSVDGAGQPSARLAGETVANIAADSTTRPITVTFTVPAQVTAGTRYAVVVTRASGSSAAYESAGSNPCPDGQNWFSTTPSGPFTSNSAFDLHFETVVTA